MTTRQYAAAGVDLASAEASHHRVAELVAGARSRWSLGAVGAFGGMVSIPPGFADPVLVMSSDGVGTKVLVAQQAGRFDTVGEDLVNHCVNDILVHGGEPLAFLDYVAGHELTPDRVADVVTGVARGCQAHGMALAGGETAQMPGLYAAHTFDLAGTIVGIVERSRAIHGDAIRAGDQLVALASTGLHTNGYSLARRVLFDVMGCSLATPVTGTDTALGDALLAVHRSYHAALRPVLDRVHGLAHITGGGIAGNLVRVLPDGCQATIDPTSWIWPPVFAMIAEGGDVSVAEMREVFNLGVGMIAVVPPADAAGVRRAAGEVGIHAWICGTVHAGVRSVVFAH